MKTNKRTSRKLAYQRYSAYTGGVMGPPIEAEYLASQKKAGKGWNLASDILGAATAFFSGGWKKPYEDTTTQVVQPAKNNTPLFIGLAIVVILIIAVVITRKK